MPFSDSLLGSNTLITSSDGSIIVSSPIGTSDIKVNPALAGSSAGSADTKQLYAYVSSYNSNSVSVINTATNTIVTTITDGYYFQTPQLIAITPNGLYAYVVNNNVNAVSIINISNNSIIATLSISHSPHGIAITPNGLYAYIADSYNSLHAFNTITNNQVAQISTGFVVDNVAITPNGLYVYLTGSNIVAVINTVTNTVVTTIGVNGSNGIAITPNGLYAYVTTNSGVSVINTVTNTVVTTIGVSGSNGIAITPNGLYAYVTTNSGVSVINTVTNTVISTIVISGGTSGIAITPSQTLATASLPSTAITYNRQYYQNQTAFTTTATAPTLVTGASIGITPNASKMLLVDAVVRVNNNTLNDGVVIGLYSGATAGALTTLLESETYTQADLASNSTTIQLHYEQIAAIGTQIFYSLAVNAVTGGTASVKVVKLAAAEYPDKP